MSTSSSFDFFFQLNLHNIVCDLDNNEFNYI